ncbi:MAG: (Fe-S)-binding protein [Cyclobacteriaceae bacterium]
MNNRIALFIPCYVDQFYPQVGIASLELLKKLGCQVEYPMDQTCCGQPMANAGNENDARAAYHHYIDTFKSYDYVVAPSGSCVYHVRKHFDIIKQTKKVAHLRKNTLDLSEFLIDVLKVEKLEASFPFKVGLHQSCHGQRGLRLGHSSERVGEDFSKLRQLLHLVKDLKLQPLDRVDECCGFGGTFAVTEDAISVQMGQDRLDDHQRNGVEVITAGDMSCLMHLEGIARREKSSVRIMHIAEILNHE